MYDGAGVKWPLPTSMYPESLAAWQLTGILSADLPLTKLPEVIVGCKVLTSPT